MKHKISAISLNLTQKRFEMQFQTFNFHNTFNDSKFKIQINSFISFSFALISSYLSSNSFLFVSFLSHSISQFAWASHFCQLYDHNSISRLRLCSKFHRALANLLKLSSNLPAPILFAGFHLFGFEKAQRLVCQFFWIPPEFHSL